MSHEEEPNDHLEKLTRRQAERLAAKPDPAPKPLNSGFGPLRNAEEEADDLARKIVQVERIGADAEKPGREIPKPTGPFGTISPWIPENDPHIQAAVGKLGEEAAELAKACHRVSMAGLDTASSDNPELTNRDEVYRELADIMAASDVFEMFAPNNTINITERREKKRNGFLYWHGLIRDAFMKGSGNGTK